MPEIQLTEQTVGLITINRAIEEFNLVNFEEGGGELVFCAKVEIIDIDILFIGYLILFKQTQPTLRIVLKLEINQAFGSNSRLSFKLIQAGIYAYLMTGKNVFTVYFNDKEYNFDSYNYTSFPKNWFALSDNFMLLLYVCKNDSFLFDYLFETPITVLTGYPLHKGVTGIVWNANDEIMYGDFQKRLIQEANPKDRKKCIIQLAQTAYYNCLRHAKVLSIYMDNEYQKDPNFKRPDIYAGNLSSRKVKDGEVIYDNYIHFEKVRHIFLELHEKPVVYQLVFSTLTSSALLPSVLNHTTKSDFTNTLNTLWDFTKDFVHGLKELAKNAQEHSSNNMGLITAQIIHSPVTAGTVFYSNSFIKNYTEGLKGGPLDNTQNFLSVHVCDLGVQGIIPTLLKNSKELVAIPEINYVLKQLVEEDIEHITHKVIGLEHLFTPEKNSQLNQQCKRSIAHLGLLTFSKLIISNRGALGVTSLSMEGELESITVPKSIKQTEETIHGGTALSIILPIQPYETYKSHLPHPLYLPIDSSVNQLQGIEELFLFNIDDLTKSFAPPTEPCIFSLLIEEFNISDRKTENDLWNYVSAYCKKIFSSNLQTNKYLVHLDFDKVQINASQLLRFIGTWEIEKPKECLLISNIPSEVFFELKHINDLLTESNSELDFWNDKIPLIIYSFIEDSDKDRFYFTDVFWGRTTNDFDNLNRLISRNHFNSTSLMNSDDIAGLVLAPVINSIESIAFYRSNVLLPFDLLLTGKNGDTIFENNAAMLLKNEI